MAGRTGLVSGLVSTGAGKWANGGRMFFKRREKKREVKVWHCWNIGPKEEREGFGCMVTGGKKKVAGVRVVR